MQPKCKKTAVTGAIGIITAFGLTGCGAGGGGADNVSAPEVNTAAFEEMVSYCGATRPSGIALLSDGWVSENPMHTSNHLYYQTGSIVSAAGSSHRWDTPIIMKVPVFDYRGVSGTFVTSGYGKPEWVKGAAIPTVLKANSVACVVDLPKIQYPIASPLAGIPNLPTSMTSQFSDLPTLSWHSYWTKNIPMAQLPGYPVDGLELVSNFNPSDGQIFFHLDKSQYSSPQDLSICYLAPTAGRWNCATPTVSDLGGIWAVFQRGAKPGMYVLISSKSK